MKIINKSDVEYSKIVHVKDEENYSIKTNLLNNEEEVICPIDASMKVCKTGNKVYIKKKSRFRPF